MEPFGAALHLERTPSDTPATPKQAAKQAAEWDRRITKWYIEPMRRKAAAEKVARKPGPCRKALPGPEKPEGQK